MDQNPFQFVLLRDAPGHLSTSATVDDVVRIVRDSLAPVWVHVDSSRCTDWPKIAERMGYHPLAIEDTLSPECRVKIEEYEHEMFIVVRDACFAKETPEPYDFASTNLYLFLGSKDLVTVHAGDSRPVQTLRDRLAASPELLERGIDYLAYS
jgi:magnesium transporter